MVMLYLSLIVITVINTFYGRIEFLLELAFLSLQLKEQFMAEECVKALKAIDDLVSGVSAPYSL